MPDLDTGAQDQLLLHQFWAGLPCDISKPIRAASDVKSLDQASKRARLLMAVDSDNSSLVAAVTQPPIPVRQELKDHISELTEQVAVVCTTKATAGEASNTVSQLWWTRSYATGMPHTTQSAGWPTLFLMLETWTHAAKLSFATT